MTQSEKSITKYDAYGLTKIKPYEHNAKIHTEEQISHIAKSIELFGWQQPIVIDENDIIIIGHGRFEAAKKLSLTQVPVWVSSGLTDSEKNALRLADNKINSETGFDEEALRLSLEQITDMPMVDLGLTFEIKNLFAPESTEDDFDATSVLEQDCLIKQGDLIELGNHRVLCGDSTNLEDIKKLLGDNKPALMVTDPPYGVNYNPEWRDECDLADGHRSVGKVANDGRADWTEVWKSWPCDVIYCWHAAGKFESIAQASIEAAGFAVVSQIIWVKQHFALSRGDYHWQHEPCLYACKGPHNWQGARDQSTIWNIKNNNSFGNHDKEETFGHGTQKPIECMARPIRNNSKVGELICDPFLGSGTTLIAAEMLERKCFGMEILPVYCAAIIERYKKHCETANKPCVCKVNGEII